jgi:probable HAF family extracellular repeat protein
MGDSLARKASRAKNSRPTRPSPWARAFLAVLLATALLTHSTLARAQTYSLLPVPSPPIPVQHFTSVFVATGINANGQLSGTTTNCELDEFFQCMGSHTAATIYSDGSFIELPGCMQASASAINAAGQAVGICDGNGVLVDTDGTSQGLDAAILQANALNAEAQVTGSLTSTNDAFIWSNGSIVDLGKLDGGGSSIGYGINDAGAVVGQATDADDHTHSFIAQNGSLTDLGTLGGDPTELNAAYAINDAGQVVGVAGAASGSHAFLYSNGTMTDLGTLGGNSSAAYAINSRGSVVGTSDMLGGSTHAFLYTAGVMTDLNSLLVASDRTIVVTDATAINDNGWIVIRGGSYVAVPLTFVPRTLQFASELGTAGAVQNLILTNTGSEPFPTATLSITGAYSYTSDCPASLIPGTNCSLAVKFVPTAAGHNAGGLSVAGLPAVALDGTAAAPVVPPPGGGGPIDTSLLLALLLLVLYKTCSDRRIS